MNARRAGFTLLELVIVLSILSLVALLAAHSLHSAQDQHRYAAANRQLDALRAAIWPQADPVAPSGPALPGGFVADLGRLPRAIPVTNADASTVAYTLSELAVRPSDVPAFALLQLSADAVCAASPAPYDPALDAGISLPTGWRGPYLAPRAAADPADFRDPWGAPLAAYPLDLYGLTNRLSADGSFADPAPFAPVAYVRHLGADLAPADTPYAVSNAFHADRVLDLTPATNATALLTFDVPADSAAAAVVFRLYLPCPCTGSSDADAPRAHVLSATLPATPGTVATTAFAPVPAGWHPAAAMPEGEPELRRTFWILAR